jgi:A/G-specific adenine glycosylase
VHDEAPDAPAADEELVRRLLDWYASSARNLPWRAADRTPWGVLVSEVMLQQTPVARVLPVWRDWLARWPSPADLAAEPSGEAVRAWGRLGYPRRALRLHRAAQQVVERHGGEVPDDVTALRALDGVGHYTASAVSTFAFGHRHPVVDTNVRRVLARVVEGRALPAPTLTAREQRLAAGLVPADRDTAARWAIAVMELGAVVCTARAPRCAACPVADRCAWRRAGAPAYEGPARRGQTWAGTDRQVRGRLLAVLRDTRHPVGDRELHAAVPDDVLRDPLQRARALASLVEDGLVESGPSGYALPG